MSELKTYFLGKNNGREFPVYLKSEADAVIAELKNEVETQKRLRDMALASVPNALKVMKIIQHQKYKRCLAMARWCFTKSNYHFVLARHGEVDLLVLRNGYRSDSPKITFKNPRIRIGTGRTEWGAEPGKQYFAITWEE